MRFLPPLSDLGVTNPNRNWAINEKAVLGPAILADGSIEPRMNAQIRIVC